MVSRKKKGNRKTICLKKKNRNSTLCRPDTTQSLGHTNIVCLELVQTDGGGEGECAQEPVAGGAELGHTGRREVVDNGGPGGEMLDCDFQICRSRVDLRELRDSAGRLLLESDVRVSDNQRAQDGVHDGVEGASGEGSEGERDQADADQSEIDVSRGFSLRMSGLSEGVV